MRSADGAPATLRRGAHTDPGQGMCLMEYVSVRAGSGFSDRPACCHPALAAVARAVNDRVSDRARAGLVRFEPALRGTNTGCPGATEAVVSACGRHGLAFAPRDRRLRRLVATTRVSRAHDGGCPPASDPDRGVWAWHRRRRTAYRTEMAVFDALGAIVAATPAGAGRDAALVGLLADVVQAHRRRCPELDPVAVDPVAVDPVAVDPVGV